MIDPYATLGLPSGASLDEVKRAYRALAKRYHPDSAGEAAMTRFLAIQAAYEALTDPRPSTPKEPGGSAAPAPRPSNADSARARATREAYRTRRTGSPGATGAAAGGPGGDGRLDGRRRIDRRTTPSSFERSAVATRRRRHGQRDGRGGRFEDAASRPRGRRASARPATTMPSIGSPNGAAGRGTARRRARTGPSTRRNTPIRASTGPSTSLERGDAWNGPRNARVRAVTRRRPSAPGPTTRRLSHEPAGHRMPQRHRHHRRRDRCSRRSLTPAPAAPASPRAAWPRSASRPR